MPDAYEVDVHDEVYRTVGGADLLARVYRPRGTGPFPAVLDVHGGVWTRGSRLSDAAIDLHLARAGIVVASVDVRQPPGSGYPDSIDDVRAGIGWLRSRAGGLGSRPDLVGCLGCSSGGHQVLLAVLGGGPAAPVRFLVLCWPVADPARRFRWAAERGLDELVRRQLSWFGSEATMEEASPDRIVRAWDGSPLPPALLVQGTADENLPSDMADRFADAYRAAGGAMRLEVFPGAPHSFVLAAPDGDAATTALAVIREFVGEQVTGLC